MINLSIKNQNFWCWHLKRAKIKLSLLLKMDGRKNLIFMFYLLKRGSIVLSIVAFEFFANFGNKKAPQRAFSSLSDSKWVIRLLSITVDFMLHRARRILKF